MLLSPGQKVRNSDMHLLDMVSTDLSPHTDVYDNIMNVHYHIIYKVTFSVLKDAKYVFSIITVSHNESSTLAEIAFLRQC